MSKAGSNDEKPSSTKEDGEVEYIIDLSSSSPDGSPLPKEVDKLEGSLMKCQKIFQKDSFDENDMKQLRLVFNKVYLNLLRSNDPVEEKSFTEKFLGLNLADAFVNKFLQQAYDLGTNIIKFLSKHDRENVLSKCGAIRHLVYILKNRNATVTCKFAKLVLPALDALANMCALNTESRLMFGQEGGCIYLTEVVKELVDRKDFKTLVQACVVVRSLTVNSDHVLIFSNSGCCEAMVKALEVGWKDHCIRLHSLGALANFLDQNPDNVALVEKSGGLSGIIVGCKSEGPFLLSKSLALHCIHNICVSAPPYRKKLGELLSCEAVTKALLSSYKENAAVAKWGCAAIAMLCKDDKPNRDRFANGPFIIVNEEASEKADNEPANLYLALAECPTLHKTNVGVCEMACAAIAHMSHKHPRNIARFKSSPRGNVLNALFMSLTVHLHSASVCEHAFAAIANLEDIRINTISFEIVLRAIDAHIHKPAVCQQACRALAFAARVSSPLLGDRAQIFKTLLKVLQTHTSNQPTVRQALIAAYFCGGAYCNVSVLSKIELNDILKKFLEVYHTDPIIVKYSLRLFACVRVEADGTQFEQEARKRSRLDTAEGIVLALKSPLSDADVFTSACFAMTTFIDISDNRADIRKLMELGAFSAISQSFQRVKTEKMKVGMFWTAWNAIIHIFFHLGEDFTFKQEVAEEFGQFGLCQSIVDLFWIIEENSQRGQPFPLPSLVNIPPQTGGGGGMFDFCFSACQVIFHLLVSATNRDAFNQADACILLELIAHKNQFPLVRLANHLLRTLRGATKWEDVVKYGFNHIGVSDFQNSCSICKCQCPRMEYLSTDFYEIFSPPCGCGLCFQCIRNICDDCLCDGKMIFCRSEFCPGFDFESYVVYCATVTYIKVSSANVIELMEEKFSLSRSEWWSLIKDDVEIIRKKAANAGFYTFDSFGECMRQKLLCIAADFKDEVGGGLGKGRELKPATDHAQTTKLALVEVNNYNKHIYEQKFDVINIHTHIPLLTQSK